MIEDHAANVLRSRTTVKGCCCCLIPRKIHSCWPRAEAKG
jgi:hypothetical protein